MNAPTLISASDLLGRLNDPQLLIVDCRFELSDPQAGARAYQQGHIPGAIHADLDKHLSDPSRKGLGRHPLPSADAFARWLASIGWTPAHSVVAYDSAGGALAAARLWWLLRISGHLNVAVLDGGFGAWKDAGLELEAVTREQPASIVVPLEFAADQMFDYAQLQTALADDSMLLIDARGAARYRGEVEPIDPVAGHVPGAGNRSFTENLDANGFSKPAAQLREEWLALIGQRTPQQVVHMCGSGVSACQNLLAMEHAGLHGSRLFAPSWSGWISDPARPVASSGKP